MKSFIFFLTMLVVTTFWCGYVLGKVEGREMNLMNCNVTIRTSDNFDNYEMFSKNSTPSVECSVDLDVFKKDPAIKMSWEYCNEFGDKGITTKIKGRNEIELELYQIPDPGEYCARCVIKSGNGSIAYKSKKIIITVRDTSCNTPPRHRYEKGVYYCAVDKKPDKTCQRHQVNSLKLLESVNKYGEREVRLSWRKPNTRLDTTYGFHISMEILDDNFAVNFPSVCIITKYLANGTYPTSLTVARYAKYTQYTILKDAIIDYNPIDEQDQTLRTHVRFRISSLPIFKPISKAFYLKSREQLCTEYLHKHGTIPEQCFPFQNIKVREGCISRKTKYLKASFIRLSWTVRKKWNYSNNPNINRTHVRIMVSGLMEIYDIPINKTTLDIDLKGMDISSYTAYNMIGFIRFCSVCGIETVSITDISLPMCPTKPPITTDTTESPFEEQAEILTRNKLKFTIIAVGFAALLISLIVILLGCYYRKVKKDIRKICSKLPSLPDQKDEWNEHLKVEENNIPTVMLVYPHGCVEMEDMVIFLTSQLNTFGIRVLSDIVQSEMIAEHSLPKVLVDNFNNADYVVVLCDDDKGNQRLHCHKPYEFVLHQLISNECVFNSHKQRNYNRFIAVYFSSIDSVPSYLLSRVYNLPNQFSQFVQNLFGLRSHFSLFHSKIFKRSVPEYSKRKEELQRLSDNLVESDHVRCCSYTCKKGKPLEPTGSLEDVATVPLMGDKQGDEDGSWESSEEEVTIKSTEKKKLIAPFQTF